MKSMFALFTTIAVLGGVAIIVAMAVVDAIIDFDNFDYEEYEEPDDEF